MALIRKLFWVALFLVSTFGFVVLFDYGTTNYIKNAQLEYNTLKKFVGWQPKPKKDESDKTDTK
jgi:hypothetical protein